MIEERWHHLPKYIVRRYGSRLKRRKHKKVSLKDWIREELNKYGGGEKNKMETLEEIKKNILHLKTNNRFFGMERDGEKPYTVRIMDPKEYLKLVDTKVDTIHIQNADFPVQCFEREIISIVLISEFLGKHLVGIAWRSNFGRLRCLEMSASREESRLQEEKTNE